MAICVVAVSPNFVSYNTLLPACPHRCISPHLPVLQDDQHPGTQRGTIYSWLLLIIITVHPPKKIPLEGHKYDVWGIWSSHVIPPSLGIPYHRYRIYLWGMTIPFDGKSRDRPVPLPLRVLTPGGSKSHLVNTLMCGLAKQLALEPAFLKVLWNIMEPGHGKSPL